MARVESPLSGVGHGSVAPDSDGDGEAGDDAVVDGGVCGGLVVGRVEGFFVVGLGTGIVGSLMEPGEDGPVAVVRGVDGC